VSTTANQCSLSQLNNWPSLSPPPNFHLPDDFLGVTACHGQPLSQGKEARSQGDTSMDALLQQIIHGGTDSWLRPLTTCDGAPPADQLQVPAAELRQLGDRGLSELADFGSLLGVGDTPSWIPPTLQGQQQPAVGDRPFAGLFAK
jgi:hypothetical protein